MTFIKIILLIGLVRLLIAVNRPLLCASIYTGALVAFGLMFGRQFLPLLIATPIGFGLSFLYFWLLDRFEGTGWFWFILIVGVLIGLV